MAQSLQRGHRITLSQVDGFADGVAVKSVGAETFRLCQELVDGVIMVSKAEICDAIKIVFQVRRGERKRNMLFLIIIFYASLKDTEIVIVAGNALHLRTSWCSCFSRSKSIRSSLWH